MVEEVTDKMLQDAIEGSNNTTPQGDPIAETETKQPKIVYFRGKPHEVLSEIKEDGSIVPEDNQVRIKEVGTNRTRSVAPKNLYEDEGFKQRIKTYPPKLESNKKKKVTVDDYNNPDVDVNDVADAYLSEFGEDLTIETLQGQWEELQQEAEKSTALKKAKAKVTMKRLQEISNAVGDKIGKSINLESNQVENVVDDVVSEEAEKKLTNNLHNNRKNSNFVETNTDNHDTRRTQTTDSQTTKNDERGIFGSPQSGDNKIDGDGEQGDNNSHIEISESSNGDRHTSRISRVINNVDILEISNKIETALTKASIPHTKQNVRIASPKEFHDAIANEKKQNPNGW